MKFINTIAVAAVVMLTFAACQKQNQDLSIQKDLQSDGDSNDLSASLSKSDEGERGNRRGNVYTLSNQASGNSVMVYSRSANGELTYKNSFATGGNGTGGGLGNQGAVVISDDVLLVVNAGSNTISSFKMTGDGLNLKSTVSSGGTRPISIAVHNDIVYVLNGGGAENISGFKLGSNSKLTPIQNSTRPLSSSTVGSAQISFVRNGSVLVITEKGTNKIITYKVDEWGIPGVMHSITSASPTPFGFATGRLGSIFVSEAVGGAANASNVSSYQVNSDGSISLSEGPVATMQSAACWVVITNDGRNLFTTNTASNTISSFRVMPNSVNIDLLESIAASTDMGPIDAALTNNSQYLYILNSVSHTISGYSVSSDGGLILLSSTITGLPVGTNGLAAD